MKDLLVLAVHLFTMIAKLMGPGGARAIVAESLLMKQQLLVVNRSRQRAPNLSALDRFLFGFWSLFLNPRRIPRSAVIIKPSTLLRFREALVRCKYQWLYSSGKKGKPGPKGPSPELIQAIVEMKLPISGCPPGRRPELPCGLLISSKRPDFTPTTRFNPVQLPSRQSRLVADRFTPQNSS